MQIVITKNGIQYDTFESRDGDRHSSKEVAEVKLFMSLIDIVKVPRVAAKHTFDFLNQDCTLHFKTANNDLYSIYWA